MQIIRYQLGPSHIRKMPKENGDFLETYSLLKKTKGVPVPFHDTLIDSFRYIDINEPRL